MVGEIPDQALLIFDSLSQSRALIRATDMCDPVDQLMHRVSEWFVRQPPCKAAARSTWPGRLLLPTNGRGDLANRPAALPEQLDRPTAEPLPVRGMHAWHGHHILSVGWDRPKRSGLHETGDTAAKEEEQRSRACEIVAAGATPRASASRNANAPRQVLQGCSGPHPGGTS